MTALRSLLYLAVFISCLGIFLPKFLAIHHFLGTFSGEYQISLTPESLSKGLGESLENTQIRFMNSPVANIKKANLFSIGFFNSLSAREITLEGLPASFMPQRIAHVQASHSIFSPTKIHLEAEGEFGTMSGYLDLVARKMNLVVRPSDAMKNNFGFALRKARKQKNDYIFESKL